MSSGTIETISQQQQQQGPQPQGVARARLVQRLLDGSPDLPTFVHDLLTTQAVVVAGTEAAGFVIQQQGDQIGLQTVAHIRPDNSDAATRAAAVSAFQEIVRPCITQNKDGAIEISSGDDSVEPRFCLVTLLRNNDQAVAVSAVITRARDVERARQRLMSMQLVAGYFDMYTLRRNTEQTKIVAQSHQHVLQLANAVANAEGFDAAAMNLCNELATRTGATRVSVGWLKRSNIRVKAISHTEKFDKKQDLIVELERVMEECYDQEEVVRFDPDGGSTDNVTREAAAFSRAHDGMIVLSLPLRRRDEISGVMTLEFAREQKLPPNATTGLTVAVDLLAPQLYDRYQNDRWLITKAGLSTRDTARMIVGPKHMVAKLVVTLLLSLALFVVIYSPMYRIAAPFEFAAVEKRALPAPFNGHVARALVKPGDIVELGQPLLELDHTEAMIDMGSAQSRAHNHKLEADRLYAEGRIGESNQARAHQRAAEYEVQRFARQIELATIKAPIAGEIVRGNWTERINAPVRQGELLLEIAQRDTLRAELFVPERHIQSIDPDRPQTGFLATSSLPNERFPFTIERIVPLAEPREGRNVFRVYATLSTEEGAFSPQWRPGMMGEARIDVEPRSLLWQWTHRLVDFVRLKTWI